MSKKPRLPPSIPNNAPATIQGTIQTFSSPYPLPQQLEAFERFAGGSAKDILATAQESIRHQERLHETALKAQIARDQHMNSTMRWVLILAIAGAFVLTYLNRDTASYVFLFAELATLAGAILYGKIK